MDAGRSGIVATYNGDVDTPSQKLASKETHSLSLSVRLMR